MSNLNAKIARSLLEEVAVEPHETDRVLAAAQIHALLALVEAVEDVCSAVGSHE
jgi:hypothetical protein